MRKWPVILFLLPAFLFFSFTPESEAKGARLDYMLDRLSERAMTLKNDKHNIFAMGDVKTLTDSIADRVILDRTSESANYVADYVKNHTHMEFLLEDMKRFLKSSIVRSINLELTLEKERIFDNALEYIRMQKEYDTVRTAQTCESTPGVSQPVFKTDASSSIPSQNRKKAGNTGVNLSRGIPGGGNQTDDDPVPYPNVAHTPEEYDTWTGWSQYGKWIPIYSRVQFQKAYLKALWDGYWQGKIDALKWKEPVRYYTPPDAKGLPVSYTNGLKRGFLDGYRVSYERYREQVRRPYPSTCGH